MKMENNKEHRVAYHEAGHALACFFVGMRFKKVTIVPRKNAVGSLVHHRISFKMYHELNWYDNTRTQVWHTNHMVISLAGAEATKLVFGRSYGHKHDYHDASDMAIRECGTGEAPKAYLRFLHILTKEFLEKDRKLLDKVANALIEKKTLKYNEFMKLMPKKQ